MNTIAVVEALHQRGVPEPVLEVLASKILHQVEVEPEQLAALGVSEADIARLWGNHAQSGK